jgi:hypothetical protein
MRDLSGQKFGRLIPLRVVSRKPIIWECQCDCGVICEIRAAHFVPSKLGLHVRSCGCLRAETAGNRTRKRPYEWLYNIVKSRKKWVNLTYEEFLEFTQVQECHYCSAPVFWRKTSSGANRTSCYNLDCKNNSLGYTKANVVVCCTRCNAGKSDKFTYEEWVEIGKVLRSLREKALAATV